MTEAKIAGDNACSRDVVTYNSSERMGILIMHQWSKCLKNGMNHTSGKSSDLIFLKQRGSEGPVHLMLECMHLSAKRWC